MSESNEDEAKDPIDARKGTTWLMMKSIVLKLAETPMDYVAQCKVFGITPDKEYIDKRYLTHKHTFREETWTFKGKLWRWGGPCKIVGLNQKIYNNHDASGFIKKTVDGFTDKIRDVIYVNDEGVMSNEKGPARIEYYINGQEAKITYLVDNEYPVQEKPVQIEYYPNGNLFQQIFKGEEDKLQIYDYHPNGNLKKLVETKDKARGRGTIYHYDKNGKMIEKTSFGDNDFSKYFAF